MKYFLTIFFFVIINMKSNILGEGVNYTDIEYSGVYSIFKELSNIKKYSTSDIFIDTNSSILTSKYVNYFNQSFFFQFKTLEIYFNIPINDEILFEEKSVIYNKFSFIFRGSTEYKNIPFHLGINCFFTPITGLNVEFDISKSFNTPLGLFLFKFKSLFNDVTYSFFSSNQDFKESNKRKNKLFEEHYRPNIKIGYGNEFSNSYFSKIKIALEINNLFFNSPFVDVYYKDYNIYKKLEIGLELLKDIHELLSFNIRIGMKNLKPIFRSKLLLNDSFHLEYCFHNISIGNLDEIKYFHIFSFGISNLIEDLII